MENVKEKTSNINLSKRQIYSEKLFGLFTEEYIKEFGTSEDTKDVYCNSLLEWSVAKETKKGKQRVFSFIPGEYIIWVEHYTDGELDHKTWYAKLAYYVNIQYPFFEFSFSNIACSVKKIIQNFEWDNSFEKDYISFNEEETEYEWIKHVEVITTTRFFAGYVGFADAFHDKKEAALTKFLCELNKRAAEIK